MRGIPSSNRVSISSSTVSPSSVCLRQMTLDLMRVDTMYGEEFESSWMYQQIENTIAGTGVAKPESLGEKKSRKKKRGRRGGRKRS